MRDLLAVLERIATGIERLVEASDHSKSSVTEAVGRQREKDRKGRAFWLRLETDARFPGLKGKISSPDFCFSPELVDAVLDRDDPVAIIEYLTRHKPLLVRLYTSSEEDVAREIDAIEERLREAAPEGSTVVSLHV